MSTQRLKFDDAGYKKLKQEGFKYFLMIDGGELFYFTDLAHALSMQNKHGGGNFYIAGDRALSHLAASEEAWMSSL